MADQKLYDLVVTTGQYVDREGNEKREYENIGAVFQGQNGMYAIMKKTFNPAGVPSDRSSFFVNFYEPRDRNAQFQQQSRAPQQARGPAYPQQAPQDNTGADFNDDIPF